jgi:predicted peptidase
MEANRSSTSARTANDKAEKMKVLKIVLLISVMGLAAFLFSKNKKDYSAYESEFFIKNNDTLPYRILYPLDFDKSKKYPIIFFLHGSGELGNDNKAQLTLGGALFVKKKIREDFQAIVIFPQCSKNSFWSNVGRRTENNREYFAYKTGGEPTKDMDLLLQLINQFKTNPNVDNTRMYAMGISMGGMGVFELLRREPGTFAAAVVICGGDDPSNAEKYGKDVSVWVFHGAEDNVVPVSSSVVVAEKLKELGNEVKLTIYPKVGHSSWDDALDEEELLPWLFSKRKL